MIFMVMLIRTIRGVIMDIIDHWLIPPLSVLLSWRTDQLVAGCSNKDNSSSDHHYLGNCYVHNQTQPQPTKGLYSQRSPGIPLVCGPASRSTWPTWPRLGITWKCWNWCHFRSFHLQSHFHFSILGCHFHFLSWLTASRASSRASKGDFGLSSNGVPRSTDPLSTLLSCKG